MDGQYLVCPHCHRKITEDEQYEFLDVSEDILGRDVIRFRHYQCGQAGESFVYIKGKR